MEFDKSNPMARVHLLIIRLQAQGEKYVNYTITTEGINKVYLVNPWQLPG